MKSEQDCHSRLRRATSIGFDATCSLACLDARGGPVGVHPERADDDSINVIAWCDHRATRQAAAINETGHARLATVGGAVSPEMQLPKIMWLRERMPRSFARAGLFLDLADYLTMRAADGRPGTPRSLCTVACKWCGVAGN